MSKPNDISQEAWDEAWGAEAWARPHYAPGTSEDDKPKVVEVIARAIMATTLAERERIRSAVVGHIMTVVESLMEGRMTGSGLTPKDHIEMQAQIEGLEVVADEIQAMTFNVNTAHKFSEA